MYVIQSQAAEMIGAQAEDDARRNGATPAEALLAGEQAKAAARAKVNQATYADMQITP